MRIQEENNSRELFGKIRNSWKNSKLNFISYLNTFKYGSVPLKQMEWYLEKKVWMREGTGVKQPVRISYM